MTPQNNSLAAEMLELLLKNLQNDFNEIKRWKETNNTLQFKKSLHKLHGAVCYCGVPPLKNAIADLETALAHNKTAEIQSLFDKFEREIKKLLNL